MVDEQAGAFVALGDLGQDGADVGQVGGVLRQEAQRGLRVAEDGGERLVQFVGQGAREIV